MQFKGNKDESIVCLYFQEGKSKLHYKSEGAIFLQSTKNKAFTTAGKIKVCFKFNRSNQTQLNAFW